MIYKILKRTIYFNVFLNIWSICLKDSWNTKEMITVSVINRPGFMHVCIETQRLVKALNRNVELLCKLKLMLILWKCMLFECPYFAQHKKKWALKCESMFWSFQQILWESHEMTASPGFWVNLFLIIYIYQCTHILILSPNDNAKCL